MTENGTKTEWHLKKEVSYGHIISTLMLSALLIAGWIDIQKRIAVLELHPLIGAHNVAERRLDILEAATSKLDTVNIALTLRFEDLQNQIIRSLDRQDIKLDRIEDRLNAHDISNGKSK